MAAIPVYISQMNKEKNQRAPQAQMAPSTPDPAQSIPDQSGATPAPDSQQGSSSKPKMNFAAALGVMALLGLASPFLELQDPVHGAIGLVILFVGINIAWRMTAAPKLDILGPFAASAPKPAATT
jgi:hypothetical protein